MEEYVEVENLWVGVFVNGDVWSHTENIMMGMAPRDYLEAHGCLSEDINAVLLEELRTERNKLLAETDWTQNNDVPETTTLKWQEYRQSLRDITEQYASVYDVVWPEKPV